NVCLLHSTYMYMFVFFSMMLLSVGSTLFPYTTLFRSGLRLRHRARVRGGRGRHQVRARLDAGLSQDAAPVRRAHRLLPGAAAPQDRKITRLNSSHVATSYAAFCLKKNKTQRTCVTPAH